MDNYSTKFVLREALMYRIARICFFFMFGYKGLFLIWESFFAGRKLVVSVVGGLIGFCLLAFAVLWVYHLADYVKVNVEGIYQRDGLKERSMRWTQIGAYALDDEFEVIAFLNQAQIEIVIQVSLVALPASGGWPKKSRDEFRAFMLAKLVELKIERLPVNDPD